jgi:hypothetical protein
MPCPDWAFPQPCRLFIPYVDDLPYTEHQSTICQPLGGSSMTKEPSVRSKLRSASGRGRGTGPQLERGPRHPATPRRKMHRRYNGDYYCNLPASRRLHWIINRSLRVETVRTPDDCAFDFSASLTASPMNFSTVLLMGRAPSVF